MSASQTSGHAISSPLTRLRTSVRAAASLVTPGLLSPCATPAPPFNTQSPGRVPRPRPRRPREAEDHPDQPEEAEPDARGEGPHRGEADVSQAVRLLEPVEGLARHAHEELDADEQ